MGIFNFFRRKPKRERQFVTLQASALRSVEDQENNAYFAGAKDTSADDICSEGERSILRAKCRKILLDNPQALHAARSLALSTYGAGPALQIKTPYKELNTKVENLFNRWRKQTGYDRTFFTAIQALPSDGEAFFELADCDNCIGNIKVRLIEAFRVRSRAGESLIPNEFCGITYNEFDEPVTYTVQVVSINPMVVHPFEFVDIPASRIKHLFVPVLAGQRRGLPMLQQAINTLAYLEKIEDATLAACETAANISFVVESNLDPNVDPDNQLCGVSGASTYEAFDTVTLPRRNTGLYLPSGMKASQLKPEQPNVNFQAFKQDCLLGVGAALGAPKNIILNDSSSYNYSSARLDAQTWERWAKILQSYIVEILDAHLKDFLVVMYNRDVSVRELVDKYADINEIPFRWYFSEPTHIDRQKEAQADVTLLQNDAMTYRDFFAKQGKDVTEEFQQIAFEKRLMGELGITPEDATKEVVEEQNESDIG